MNDAELIRLASKALGNPPEGFSPLTDDGDCARMEAALEIAVVWLAEIVEALFIKVGIGYAIQVCSEKYTDHSGDKSAARRRASVRAAAMIGERMNG